VRALIIKQGAMGDVLRTTPILYPLRNMGYEIWWITAPECSPLVPRQFVPHVVAPEEMDMTVPFDLILSLDEKQIPDLARLQAHAKTVIGVTPDGYTDSSKEWFGMSLIARDKNKQRVDQVKYENKKSYQEILFGMIGRNFNREPYILNQEMMAGDYKAHVGLESRAGDRWPLKRWGGYKELARRIDAVGLETFDFKQRESLYKYSQDVGACRLVVTGDSLAMHLAIAQQKPTVALFTCTSPAEIFDYGWLTKCVSLKLRNAWYKTKADKSLMDGLSVDAVFSAVLRELV